MSDRPLYKKIPEDKRLCNYYRCQQPILRNIHRHKDGCIYHHGCLMSALDEQFRCVNGCGTFDATEVGLQEKQVVSSGEFTTVLQLVCPSCGMELHRRA